MQKAKLGNTVVYTQPALETPHNGAGSHPAIVSRVWDASDHGLLNMHVLYDFGPIAAVGSVPHKSHAQPGCAYWEHVDEHGAEEQDA